MRFSRPVILFAAFTLWSSTVYGQEAGPSNPSEPKAAGVAGEEDRDREAPGGEDGEGPSAEEEKELREALAEMDALLKSLDFKTGAQTIEGGAITLNLPEGFSFLKPADARKVIVDLWGNPAVVAQRISGLIIPRGVDLRDHENSWAAVVTYERTGYVEDGEADSINYDDLLKSMKDATNAGNDEREKQGFGAIKLVGWALPPAYDKEAMVLHWAKELDFQESSEHTLNYDVRVLGRRGVVSLNCVAGMGRLESVKELAPEIAGLASFNEGHRYADYNPSTDKKADYGLAGLVVGGAVAAKVAAKAGFFKVILTALLAGKKFVILGLLGLAAVVRKVLQRKGGA